MSNKTRNARRDRTVGGPPIQVVWETEQIDHDILTVAIQKGGYSMRGYLRRAVKNQYEQDVKAKLLPPVVEVGTAVSA